MTFGIISPALWRIAHRQPKSKIWNTFLIIAASVTLVPELVEDAILCNIQNFSLSSVEFFLYMLKLPFCAIFNVSFSN